MQDNDEKLGTRHPIKPVVMGFPADKVTCRMQTFECDPFDLLGNAPYVNLQKSFPEKGEKSRREQQILSCRKCADFNDNTMENQEEFPKCRLDFECDPFDLLGNAPYSNPPKSSPEKGEKSRREQQIFNCRKQWIFDDGSLENQEKFPKCLLDFESSTSMYSSYISLFCFALNRLFSVLTLVFDILTYFVLYVARGCLGNIWATLVFWATLFGAKQENSKNYTKIEDLAIFQPKSFFFFRRIFR